MDLVRQHLIPGDIIEVVTGSVRFYSLDSGIDDKILRSGDRLIVARPDPVDDYGLDVTYWGVPGFICPDDYHLLYLHDD